MAGKDERVNLRLAAEEKELFERAAEREGLSLSVWLRALAREAAEEMEAAAGPAAAFTPGYGLEGDA